jgi:hypothetical protein
VRLDAVVRFHRLAADLRALPFIGDSLPLLEPLVRVNQSEQPGRLRECYTPELEAAVRDWWADDVTLWERVNGVCRPVRT